MTTELDEFHASEMFNEMCRARWSKFKERLTKEQRAEMAECSARGLAEIVDARAIRKSRTTKKSDDASREIQGLVEEIERR